MLEIVTRFCWLTAGGRANFTHEEEKVPRLPEVLQLTNLFEMRQNKGVRAVSGSIRLASRKGGKL